MPTLPETFAQALQYHQAGNLRQAEQIYRQILNADPDHADSLHLLGVVAFQTGRHELAITSIRQALVLCPECAVYHSNLGVVYEGLGQMDQALASFQQAVSLQPESADAHNAVANVLRALDQLTEAWEHCTQALRIRPDFAEAHNNAGVILFLQKKLDKAVEHYQESLRLKPKYAEAHSNLGSALSAGGKTTDAIVHFLEALRINPQYAEAHNNLSNALLKEDKPIEAEMHARLALTLRPTSAEAHFNLGNALAEQKKPSEAMVCFEQAVHFRPRYAEAHNNLATLLAKEGRVEEAIACYRQAIAIKPTDAETHVNLGNAHRLLGQMDAALVSFRSALEIQPDSASAHWSRALVMLAQGDFEQGWPEYEWRWAQHDTARRNLPQPLWDGSPLEGRTILLHAEQGLGDTLHFVRYLPLVRQRGGHIILECQPELMPLLSQCRLFAEIVARGDALPAFDVQAPLLSLPGIFRTGHANIPQAVPYLRAKPELIEAWRRKLEPIHGFRVGIAWQGRPTYRWDRDRSVPLSHFAALAKVDGVRLIRLQKGSCKLSAISYQQEQGMDQITLHDLGNGLDEASGAFMDTAAVMCKLDLVISSDTAMPHLAGALGVPVWVALPFVPDWRWLLQRQDSPWYPTMRLFRQTKPGNWDEVFDRMRQSLASMVQCNTPHPAPAIQ